MKARPVLQPLDERQRYTPEEAIAYLRISRRTLFEHINTGALSSLKEGKRRFIPGSAIIKASVTPLRAAQGVTT